MQGMMNCKMTSPIRNPKKPAEQASLKRKCSRFSKKEGSKVSKKMNGINCKSYKKKCKCLHMLVIWGRRHMLSLPARKEI